MELNYKKIIINEEKNCKICGEHYNNDGIIVMKNFICQKCVQDIVCMEVNDERYEVIKEKVKSIWKTNNS